MNRLKDDLDRELQQKVFLKDDVKKRMLEQAKNPTRKQHSNWQYPVILVACTAVLVLFVTLLLQDVGGYRKVVTGAEADYGLQLDWLIELLPFVITGFIIFLLYKFYQPYELPVCESCHEEWSWRVSIKEMFSFKRGMTCPHCQGKQFQTRKSRNLTGGYVIFPNSVLLINAFLDLHWWHIVPMYVAIIFTQFIILPYIIKLQNDEDLNLW